MTSFILKCIAMISMLIDHTSVAYFGQTTLFNVIGRIAFPIFAFQISEGYIHTKNLKKYLLRLFCFAIISQVPFMLFDSMFTNNFSFNIFGTLFVGLLAILLYDKISNCTFELTKDKKFNLTINKIFGFIPAILLCIVSEVCCFDYGFWGVAIIFLFYFFKNDKLGMVIFYITSCIIKYGINIIIYGYHYLYILLCIGTILPIIFICLYNGKQGKKIKYLLYAFYPVHLLILYFIFR